MAAKYAIQQFWISNSIWTPIVCPIIWIPASANVTIFPGAYGLMNFAGITAGALITPYLGKLKDHGVPLAIGFAICAIPSIIAAVLMFVLRPTDRDRGSTITT